MESKYRYVIKGVETFFTSHEINEMADDYERRGIPFRHKSDITRDLEMEPEGGYDEYLTDNPPTKDEVMRLHFDEGMRVTDVAAHLRVRIGTAESWWKMYDIQPNVQGGRIHKMNKHDLKRMFINDGMSVQEIADHYKCTSRTMYTRLDALDIRKMHRSAKKNVTRPTDDELHTMHEVHRISVKKIADDHGVDRNEVRQWLDETGEPSRRDVMHLPPRPDCKTLRKLYIEDQLSMPDIASMYKCSPPSIAKWLKEHNIPIRTYNELTGDLSGNWLGGLSFLPYCFKFNNRMREFIRDRDNHTCQLCGQLEKHEKRKLSVHHIQYDKENCAPELISLCSSCHSITNGNRVYYEKTLMETLDDRDWDLFGLTAY